MASASLVSSPSRAASHAASRTSRQAKSWSDCEAPPAEWFVGARRHDRDDGGDRVYWKPVWHVLESSFELVLANATHIRNVPGRKTDVNDAMWIADLLAHVLIRASFVPPTPVQELAGSHADP